MDLGPHVFGSLSFLLGENLTLVGAVAVKPSPVTGKADSSNEVHCACLLSTQSGAVGTATLGWADTDYHNRFYFYGTRGTLSLNLAKGDPITVEYRRRPGKVFPPLEKGAFSPTIYGHFIDCIRRGKKPWTSGEEGLRTVELVEAAYRMIRRPVPDVL
jgi:predicted dehydrogenase